MRSIFIVFAAFIASTQAVSLQVLRNNHGRESARAQATQRHAERPTKLFAQCQHQQCPESKLTHEDYNKIYLQSLGHIDKDGNHRFTIEEAYDLIPEKQRSPELWAELKKQFEEIDTDKSGDIDPDEFIAAYTKTIKPFLEAYYQTSSSYDGESSSYYSSYPESGYSQWNSSYGGDNQTSSSYDGESSSYYSSHPDSGYSQWNSSYGGDNQTSSCYDGESSSYYASHPDSGQSQWDSTYGGNSDYEWSSYSDESWNSDYQWPSYNESNGSEDSSYAQNDSQYESSNPEE